MIGLKQKLMLGFGGLLAILLIVGGLTMTQISQLGIAIDTILRENYISIIACQEMKEALERLDSGILFTLAGNEQEGEHILTENIPKFQRALATELGNITLPGERESSEHIQTLFAQYMDYIPQVTLQAKPLAQRQAIYFTSVLPLFHNIKQEADTILLANQTSMHDANRAARQETRASFHLLLTAITLSVLLALLFGFLVQKWILHPIQRLIESTNDIRKGNFDLVLEEGGHDEIGILSAAFNDMATSLRRLRQTDRANLLRSQRAAEEVFRALPSAIAILDLDGQVELASGPAEQLFGPRPGTGIDAAGFSWLPMLMQQALTEGHPIRRDSQSGPIQHFADNREYFFQPVVAPILTGDRELQEVSGMVLILSDVTLLHEQQEMKQDVIATVSHQLRTPLTSIRMAVHLLLEERMGTLNERQLDLLITAREDSERLVSIMNDLLNINRFESGMSQIAPAPWSPRTLVRDALEPSLVEARDRGIAVINAVAEELPEVIADPQKIRHVFANLLSNAFRFTSPGGTVTISAEATATQVCFRVEDTGRGIPAEDLEHLFERFYRAPGQDDKSGTGLGLSIVKEIIRVHGGEVGVSSVIGKGSVFSFTLPLRDDTHIHNVFPVSPTPVGEA